jgi:hypothetical protein
VALGVIAATLDATYDTGPLKKLVMEAVADRDGGGEQRII